MLKFAICDDNTRILTKFSEMLENIFTKNNFDASVLFTTDNTKDMLNYISNNKIDNHSQLPHDMLQLACHMQQSEYDLKMIMWTLNNYLWKVKFDNYNIQCLLELPAVLKQHRSSMKDM